VTGWLKQAGSSLFKRPHKRGRNFKEHIHTMSNGTDIGTKLQGINLFHEFTSDEITAFLELVEPLTVKAGDAIVKQDEHGDCMYILVSGKASVIHRKEGKQFELATLGAGDFFGELALVDEGPRSADVEAIEDCTVLRIPQSLVRALAGVYPSAAFKLLVAVGRVLVSRLRKGNQKYIDSLLLAGKD
jgi:CRP/FNR family cyclic AMP-dependent transcriptional regulator